MTCHRGDGISSETSGFGIPVGVDGSAQSEAAVQWAAGEAVMRGMRLTLMHVVTPIAVSWPVGPAQANITKWQQDNAPRVIADARAALRVGGAEPPDVHTEVRYGVWSAPSSTPLSTRRWWSSDAADSAS